MGSKMSPSELTLRIIQIICVDLGIIFIFALHAAHPKGALFPTLTILPLFFSGLFVATVLFHHRYSKKHPGHQHPHPPISPSLEKFFVTVLDIFFGAALLVCFVFSNITLHRRHFDYRWDMNPRSLAFGYYAVMPVLLSICIHFYLALHTMIKRIPWKKLYSPTDCSCPHCGHRRSISPSRRPTQSSASTKKTPTGQYTAVPASAPENDQEQGVYRDGDDNERGDQEGEGRRSTDPFIV